MKYSSILFIFLMGVSFCCNTKDDKANEKQSYSPSSSNNIPNANKSMDDSMQLENEASISPPPPHLPSRFKSIEDWIKNVTDSIVHNDQIEVYDLGLFESGREYVVFIHASTAANSNILSAYCSNSLLYYKLREKEIKSLSRKEIVNAMIEKLKGFASTSKYKTSPLFRAKAVILNFGDSPVINLNASN